MPPETWYDGFPQLENGIGLTRNFLAEWDKAMLRHRDGMFPVRNNYVIPVGISAATMLQPVIEAFNERYHTKNRIIPVYILTINLIVDIDVATSHSVQAYLLVCS